MGSDFPPTVHSQISSWHTSCLFRSDATRLTTRGWNGYDLSQNRSFAYTTPKLRLDANSLTPTLLFSKSFHLCCSPTRCIELVTSILRRRKKLYPGAGKPLFIWEPVPDLCTPSELLNTTNALPYIDICSPNHAELGALMGDDIPSPTSTSASTSTPFNPASVERSCEQLLGSMPLQSFALVIRCGAAGCYIAKNGGRSRRPSVVKRARPRNHARGGLTHDTDMEALFAGLMNGDGSFEREIVPVDPGIEAWLPAVFAANAESRNAEESGNGEGDHEKVVDPTGGGNAFLGGLAVGLARGKEVLDAAVWGSVAASFAIEQVGMPILGVDAEGVETWNGVRVEQRLDEYVKKWKD